MLHPETKLLRLPAAPHRRILVTGDIHGHPDHLKEVLTRADFSRDDFLIILGDIIEKGPDSLGTLREVMALCANGNAIALIGNVDAYRLRILDEMNEENAENLYPYLLQLRDWQGSSFYDELAHECGYSISCPDDILRANADILTHFAPELTFLASRPTALAMGNFVFVHGGLPERDFDANADRDVFALTKYDRFAQSTPHVFEQYIVVGHWPVSLYNDEIQQLNPIINREKHIISIDGGCGIKREGQLNLLILPHAECTPDEITSLSYDTLPRIRALQAQTAGENSVHICWLTNEIQLLSRGAEFSRIYHPHSGRTLEVPSIYLIGDSRCRDYSDYMLSVAVGDALSLICETSRGCIVKKDGVIGWYCGNYEKR